MLFLRIIAAAHRPDATRKHTGPSLFRVFAGRQAGFAGKEDGCMAVWRRLGETIAHNMVFLVPLCLVSGVCAPDAFAVLKPLVTPMFAFVTFQGSLGNNFFNLARTFRRPAPMLVAIAISQVLMPLMGWVLGGLLFSDPNIVAGIVLEYSVPIAVTSAMWIGIYAGDMSLALGTLLISTLNSPVTIPATLKAPGGRNGAG